MNNDTAQPREPASEVVHQLRSITGHGEWQQADADGQTCIKRMPHWADLYEFRTLQVVSGRVSPAATTASASGPFTQMAAAIDAAIDAAERAHFMRRLNANDGRMPGWGVVGYSSPRASFKFRDSVVPVDVVRFPKATTASESGGGNFVGFAVTGYRTTVNVQGDASTASAGGPPAPSRDTDLVAAVRKLVKAKGRFHTEQNYKALADALSNYDAAMSAATQPINPKE